MVFAVAKHRAARRRHCRMHTRAATSPAKVRARSEPGRGAAFQGGAKRHYFCVHCSYRWQLALGSNAPPSPAKVRPMREPGRGDASTKACCDADAYSVGAVGVVGPRCTPLCGHEGESGTGGGPARSFIAGGNGPEPVPRSPAEAAPWHESEHATEAERRRAVRPGARRRRGRSPFPTTALASVLLRLSRRLWRRRCFGCRTSFGVGAASVSRETGGVGAAGGLPPGWQ